MKLSEKPGEGGRRTIKKIRVIKKIKEIRRED
jgi:hypothetical protein